MILISHRGNIEGKQPELENNPSYIDKAINLGYNVEIDLWVSNNKLYLGHDNPQYKIDSLFFDNKINKLWIHCKNIKALEWIKNKPYHYFWHEKDTITLTSQKYIWAYPGNQPIQNSIAVMPEIYNDTIKNCLGICSDYIKKYI